MDLYAEIDAFLEKHRNEICEPPAKIPNLELPARPPSIPPASKVDPPSVKTHYLVLSSLAEIGVGVVDGYVKVFLRKASPRKQDIPSQSISYPAPEWLAVKDTFVKVEKFFNEEFASDATFWITPVKFIVVERNASFSKISFKRLVGKKRKGVTLSVEEYNLLKERIQPIDAMIEAASANVPEVDPRIEKLENIALVVLRSRMERAWENPENRAKDEYDDVLHDWVDPHVPDGKWLARESYDKLLEAVDRKVVVALTTGLAAYLDLEASAVEMAKIITSVLDTKKDQLANSLFSDSTTPEMYEIARDFHLMLQG